MFMFQVKYDTNLYFYYYKYEFRYFCISRALKTSGKNPLLHVLIVLSESLMALSQLFKELKSIFIKSLRVFKFLPLNSTHVLSANRILKSNGDTLHISLTDKIKRSGTIIYSCETIDN